MLKFRHWFCVSVVMGVLTGWVACASAADAASTVDLKGIAQDLKLDDLTLKAVQISDQVAPQTAAETREIHQIQLVQSEVGTIQFSINGPTGFMTDSAKYSVLFMTAGTANSKNIVSALATDKDLIIVSYNYPVTAADIAKDSSNVSKSIRIVPGQIALALEWLSSRKYINADRLSAMGFEVGGLMLPVSLELAKLRNISVASTILAYSGASMNQMASVTKGYDSRPFLPDLKGPFLALYGTTDSVVTQIESSAQYDLLANPKSMETIEGGHLTDQQTDLVKKMADKVLEFLGRSSLL